MIDGFILNSHPSKKVVSTAGMKESKKTVMGSVVAKNVLSREVVVAQSLSARIVNKGSWVHILLGARLFSPTFFLSIFCQVPQGSATLPIIP